MSTFCHRNSDESPRVGDIADHARYGQITLLNCLMCTVDTGEFWIAETADDECVIVRESDLDNVRYYAG